MDRAAGTFEAEELFEGFTELSTLHNCGITAEKRWWFPEEIGNGYIYRTRLRSGLILGLAN